MDLLKISVLDDQNKLNELTKCYDNDKLKQDKLQKKSTGQKNEIIKYKDLVTVLNKKIEDLEGQLQVYQRSCEITMQAESDQASETVRKLKEMQTLLETRDKEIIMEKEKRKYCFLI